MIVLELTHTEASVLYRVLMNVGGTPFEGHPRFYIDKIRGKLVERCSSEPLHCNADVEGNVYVWNKGAKKNVSHVKEIKTKNPEENPAATSVDDNKRVNAAGEVVTREDLKSGFKADGDKERMDLLPPNALEAMVEYLREHKEIALIAEDITDEELLTDIYAYLFNFMAGYDKVNLLLAAIGSAFYLEREITEDDNVDYKVLPPNALLALGDLFRIGASKYENRNWERGMSWGRMIAAALRHLAKFSAGETHDSVDGQHHLTSVMWCAVCLYEFVVCNAGTDDRSSLRRAELE